MLIKAIIVLHGLDCKSLNTVYVQQKTNPLFFFSIDEKKRISAHSCPPFQRIQENVKQQNFGPL